MYLLLFGDIVIQKGQETKEQLKCHQKYYLIF